MTVDAAPTFAFDNSFVRDLEGLFLPFRPRPVREPSLLLFNDALAAELGLSAQALRSPEGVAVLVGNEVPEGAASIAQAYAGHQFGGYSPRLGDGRAWLLGEVVGPDGTRRDLHLKGSGRTPFARGGDGRAAIGPMVREYLVSEAMHALGIPTTRSLAVVATGEEIARDTGLLPGAVLVRVAASHLRVGSVQYARAQEDETLLKRLVDYAIERHHPQAAAADVPALALLDAVVTAQAELVAAWMSVGFVHGVLNTDNVTLSGESIDFGPCAFLDVFDPNAVFSSIDSGGRYSFANQAPVTLWNLSRLAEALLPLLAPEEEAGVEAAKQALDQYAPRFEAAWMRRTYAKIGLPAPADTTAPAGGDVMADLLRLLHQKDFTRGFRSLSDVLRGEDSRAHAAFLDPPALEAWLARWRKALAEAGVEEAAAAQAMDRVNPAYIPRNHLVEEALAAAATGDLAPTHALLEAITDPYTARPGLSRYAEGPPEDFGRYRTFCGT
ncbi:MAG: protein adenylyltransferase SelO [Sporichthyaceae bacterium]